MRSSRAVRFSLVAALALGAACSSDPKVIVTGQVLVYFDTDAPVPVRGDAAGQATPLFDRLRVDVFAPGSSSPCDGCSNDFELDAELFRQRSVSIGLAAPVGVSGYRVRARMFKAAFADRTGVPDSDSSIDVTFALPAAEDGVVTERTVALPTNDIGQPVGALTAPSDSVRGRPQASLVGTWPSARRIDCAAAPPPGAVCVPGGAYWMGNPNSPGFVLASSTGISAGTLDTREPRLIVVSPFFLHATEVTVEQFRAASQVPAPAAKWSGSSTGAGTGDWCTFTSAPGPHDKEPVTCLTIFEARAYCTAMGAELPTEAQFEYVAGALEGRLFPWGQDAPSCTEAVFGRAGWGALGSLIAPCRTATPPGGATPPGTGTRDRVTLPGGTILDLGGNVSEWMLDLWNRIDEPCWQRAGIYNDPTCSSLSEHDGHLVVVRGGNWGETFRALEATSRRARDPLSTNLDVGFRCAWPATAAAASR